jgi:hypothetical protein
MARELKPAVRTAGVPWVGFHTFRHTCVTRLFRRGLNANQVGVWLGHHSPGFTLATYVHLLSDDLPGSVFEDDLPESGNRGTKAPEESRNPDHAEAAETPTPTPQNVGSSILA